MIGPTARSQFVFYMGFAAGTAYRIGLPRIERVLFYMARAETNEYEMSAAEAGYMREAVDLLRSRWLPLEALRCDVDFEGARELDQALQLAIAEAAKIERGEPNAATEKSS